MKPYRTRISGPVAAAACALVLGGAAQAQTHYVPADDASRYRYADESDAQYNARVQRYMERQETRRRANPGPGLPSMEQQRMDQEAAVREAYARQRNSSLVQNPASRSNAPRTLGR